MFQEEVLLDINTSLENYFHSFRNNILGSEQEFDSAYGQKKIIYADWTASGRLYAPIEHLMVEKFGPFVGNTHTETSITGTTMTIAYHQAKEIIKKHVGANSKDCIIPVGSGMTGAVNKFQRILGLRLPENLKNKINICPEDRPVIFITHMEHHSNQTSWLETLADVICLSPDENGLVNVPHLQDLLEKYKNRKTKIAAITACSNVTGIETPYYDIAELMHKNNGYCFVDFACSAPYVDVNMHPENELQKLDAIFFSPHKFLGGPGTPGILIFDSHLYHNKIPDQVGGGTVKWTNPWQEHAYIDNIEEREDGGTPAFLQTIKAALCIQLKEKMGSKNIRAREEEMMEYIFAKLSNIEGLVILAPAIKNRLGVFSFYIEHLHYNLGVKILNDRFGIQVRGGCSCAGTYGHYLLNMDKSLSKRITCEIDKGNFVDRPGWIRMSIHPTMTNEEIKYICDSIISLTQHHEIWSKDYHYNSKNNEFDHNTFVGKEHQKIETWFSAL